MDEVKQVKRQEVNRRVIYVSQLKKGWEHARAIAEFKENFTKTEGGSFA